MAASCAESIIIKRQPLRRQLRFLLFYSRRNAFMKGMKAQSCSAKRKCSCEKTLLAGVELRPAGTHALARTSLIPCRLWFHFVFHQTWLIYYNNCKITSMHTHSPIHHIERVYISFEPGSALGVMSLQSGYCACKSYTPPHPHSSQLTNMNCSQPP